MINCKFFYEKLNEIGIDFYTGVPDSLLKDICAYISDNSENERNIIAANEGGAIGLAIGYFMATSKIPLVYMQNSGFGNTINPLLSLADPKVYGIPMLLMVGWRGEPNVKDEPQHIKQGEISEELLITMGIPYKIISAETSDLVSILSDAHKLMLKDKTPFVLLVKKGTFKQYKLVNEKVTKYDFSRESAIKMIIDSIEKDAIVISTTGKTSREVYEYREETESGHSNDFLTVGGMGHANQIALGIAIIKSKRTVYCLDGDGAVLMHTGSMGIIGNLGPKNLKHIILNNGAHDSVGGQPTIGFEVNFRKIAEAFNYNKTFKIEKISDFETTFESFQNAEGPCLLEILVNKGARNNLGRPKITPAQNKNNLIKFIQDTNLR